MLRRLRTAQARRLSSVAAGSLRGKSAIITGGSGGIGLAIAQRLAQQGVVCTITGRRREALEEALGQLPPSGQGHHHHSICVGDVREPDFWGDVTRAKARPLSPLTRGEGRHGG